MSFTTCKPLIGALVLSLGNTLASVQSQETNAAALPERPQPTQADVAYGPHPHQVFDFYRASASAPTPFVLYIHGGGFRGGSKSGINPKTLRGLLEAGISVFAIEYRLVSDAPLPAAHLDCRRALQFIRSRAEDWNLDKGRAGAFGGSAGAQLCMWLAFNDEMADTTSNDPLEHESTRLACVAQHGGQITLDFAWWKQHIPGYNTPHRDPNEVYGTSDRSVIDPIIQEISVINHVSADDPPVYSSYIQHPSDPIPDDPAKASGWKIHHVNFGLTLKEKLDVLGIENYLRYPGSEPAYASEVEFFKNQLLAR